MTNNQQIANMFLKDYSQEPTSTNNETVMSDESKNKMASLALALIKLSPYDNYDDPEMPSHIIRGRE